MKNYSWTRSTFPYSLVLKMSPSSWNNHEQLILKNEELLTNRKQVPFFVGNLIVSCMWYNHEQLILINEKSPINRKQVPLLVDGMHVSCSWYDHEQLLRLDNEKPTNMKQFLLFMERVNDKTHEQGIIPAARGNVSCFLLVGNPRAGSPNTCQNWFLRKIGRNTEKEEIIIMLFSKKRTSTQEEFKDEIL